MKVNVTVVQTLRYELTKEVEMPYKDYVNYIKTGEYDDNLMYEVSGDIDDIDWVETEEWIDSIEKAKKY
jgi:hypothetical protein